MKNNNIPAAVNNRFKKIGYPGLPDDDWYHFLIWRGILVTVDRPTGRWHRVVHQSEGGHPYLEKMFKR